MDTNVRFVSSEEDSTGSVIHVAVKADSGFDSWELQWRRLDGPWKIGKPLPSDGATHNFHISGGVGAYEVRAMSTTGGRSEYSNVITAIVPMPDPTARPEPIIAPVKPLEAPAPSLLPTPSKWPGKAAKVSHGQ